MWSRREVRRRATGEQRQVQVGLDAGFGGAHVGDRVDAVVGGGDDARVLHQPFSDRLRLQALEREAHGGVAGDLDFEPLADHPRNPNPGSRFSSPISQLTAASITGSPSTRACQRNRRAATCPVVIGKGS